MDEYDCLRDVGEIQGFFHCRVAAANHNNFLVFIEKTVASGAGGYAFARKFLFIGQAQIFGGRARGNNQRIAGVFAHVAFEAERAALQLGSVDLVKDDFRAETLGMLQKAFHQFGTLDAFREGGVVVHFRGGGELAALCHAGDDGGIQVGAGGIDGGGVACRTRA